MVAGIILAGGQSTRLGTDKASLIINKKTLLQHVLDAIAPIVSNVVIVRGHGQVIPHLSTPVKVVEDFIPGGGPIAGLFTGLKNIQVNQAYVVGCDMPFLETILLESLLPFSDGYDAIVPIVDGKKQSLHAIYSRSCLDTITNLLRKGQPGLHDLFSQVKVRYLNESKLGDSARWQRSCFNINTQLDLDSAKRSIL
jgi:molybdopterin-guanine dinucleotide biosynthesis protein A